MAQRYEQIMKLASFLGFIYRSRVICEGKNCTLINKRSRHYRHREKPESTDGAVGSGLDERLFSGSAILANSLD